MTFSTLLATFYFMSRRAEIEAAIIAAAPSGDHARPVVIGKRLGISGSYVAFIRNQLIREGTVPPIPTSRPVPPEFAHRNGNHRYPSVAQRALVDQISQNISSGATPMSLSERRTFLSELARLTTREEIKVQALSTLNRLESSINTTDDMGPPAPLTLTDATARLTDLSRAHFEIFGEAYQPPTPTSSVPTSSVSDVDPTPPPDAA
ncbi:MAG: hypothetical protein ACRDGM_01475 [bacterium]